MGLTGNAVGRHALRLRNKLLEQWLDWRYARTETAPRRLLEDEVVGKSGLGIGFFCGLGDLLYGLPVFARIKDHFRSNHLSLAAYVSNRADSNSNPRCAELARILRLFDAVKSVPSIGTERYWKAYDTSAARRLAAGQKQVFRPFIYDTQGAGSRCHAIVRGLNTRLGFSDYFEASIPGDNISPRVADMVSKLAGKDVVVYHGDTRSSSYSAAFSESVAEFLSTEGLQVVSFSPLQKLSVQAKRRVVEVPIKDISLADTLYFLNRLRPRIVAVNSVFWPLAYLLGLELFGIHILRSSDVHQFWYPKFKLLTVVETNETRELRDHGAAAIVSLRQRQAVCVLENHNLVSFSGDLLQRELFLWLKMPQIVTGCPLALPEFSLHVGVTGADCEMSSLLSLDVSRRSSLSNMIATKRFYK